MVAARSTTTRGTSTSKTSRRQPALWRAVPRSGLPPLASSTTTGTAFSQIGQPQGGMGTAFGDYDGDGRLDLIVTTFEHEPVSIYHNDGDGLFTHSSSQMGIAAPTNAQVKWGTGWLDYDCDGWLD